MSLVLFDHIPTRITKQGSGLNGSDKRQRRLKKQTKKGQTRRRSDCPLHEPPKIPSGVSNPGLRETLSRGEIIRS